jgi:hypothetical protein
MYCRPIHDLCLLLASAFLAVSVALSQPTQVSILYATADDPSLGCPCADGTAYSQDTWVGLMEDRGSAGPDYRDSVLAGWTMNGPDWGLGDGYFLTDPDLFFQVAPPPCYVLVNSGNCCWYTGDRTFPPGISEWNLRFEDWTCQDPACNMEPPWIPAPSNFRASDDSLCMEIVGTWEWDFGGPQIQGFVVYEVPEQRRYTVTAAARSCVIEPNPLGTGRFFVTAYNDAGESDWSNDDAGSSFRLKFALGSTGDVRGAQSGGSEFHVEFTPSFGAVATCPTIDSLVLLSNNSRVAALCVDSAVTEMSCRFPNATLDSCRVLLIATTVDERRVMCYDTTESLFELTASATQDPSARLPMRPEITKAYPNPFNPETRIAFTLAKPEEVRLAIYNLVGQKVRTLETGTFAEGEHTVMWDGLTDERTQAGTGLYLCRLETSGSVDTRRILLMR